MYNNIESILNIIPGKLIQVDKNNTIKASSLGEPYHDLSIFDVLSENQINDFNKHLDYSKNSRSTCEYITFDELPFKKWYKNTIKPIFDSMGRFDGYIFYQEDITEKKQIEQRAIETQFMYYEAFKNVGIGVWEYDMQTQLFNVSITLKKMLHLNSNIVSIKKWREKIHIDDQDKIKGSLGKLLNTKQELPQNIDYRIYTQKPNYIWVSTIGRIVKKNQEGSPIRILGIVRNITKQIETEKKLKKYNENLEEQVEERTKQLRIAKHEAEQANQDKSRFLSNLSHEFFTPLNIIINSSSILERKLKNAQKSQKKILSNIQISARNLNSLVENMLYLAKLDLNAIQFKFYKTDIISLLNSLVKEINNIYNIHLNIQISLTEKYMFCDTISMKMVLTELIKNSIRYSGENKNIQISVKNNSWNIIFTVKDNGLGVEESEIDTIFQRFHTGSNTSKGQAGKGLGLSICKEVIHKHNGNIWLFNNIDEPGLSVTFTIPIQEE